MSYSLFVPLNASKKEKYEAILPQIKGLVEGENDLTANLANIAAVLKATFDFFWVGFYLVKNDQLVLGPFQGPIACTRIAFGKGVCGTAWKEAKTQLVPNVHDFPGHIACSSESQSEIVLPGFKNSKVALVLDIDSDQLNYFNETDADCLEEVMKIIGGLL
ncbi:GAF domain-containing protein [Echinicola jeungdonensis]|uniref:GAF domain-containing protein n=1 Tax=Echinicola jeungdonensis TaxID=709343 RepID=A0ABV5J1U5_9BACT|nr:GAF domain-containing protein [Echinicola jeungdonensis]MDN3668942.1 GAF domain-containing protein [Echinicola jeungdonensis]